MNAMNNKIILFSALIFILSSCSGQSSDFSYPLSKKDPYIEIIHGYEIEDSYRWLEDFTSEESRDWVSRQNQFTQGFIGKNKYKKSIEKSLNKTWETESISTPYKVKDKTFYYFNDGTWQQSKLMIKECDDCIERVLLDPNNFSDDGTISLGGTSISNDASLLAYSISDGGSDWRTWKVLNINSGEILEDEISWAKFSNASWENDDSGFYYQKYDEPKDELLKEVNTAPKLMFHKLGTPQSEDQIIYENPSKPRWGWGINVLEDKEVKFLTISDGTDERNRLYVQLKKGGDFIPLIDELIGAYQYLNHKDDIYWFYTTENAKNGKVASLQIKNGSFIWNDLIVETRNSIRGVNFINNSIAVTYLVDTFSEVRFYSTDGVYKESLSLPENGSISGFAGGLDDTSSFFSFTNFVTPKKIYEIDLTTMDMKIFWEESLKDFNYDDYISDFRFYKSKDGTEIPIHISYKKSLSISQDTPVLIYGYGGFNISILPNFSKRFLSWMNQGGVVAVANLRGGGEYGDIWHEDGMLFNKQNVFDDFAYAAKYLHSQKIGSSESTAIQGGSNGGLLVAATMLQNPTLFKVAIPQVGVLDMLRFHKFTIGWAWESDYGSPNNKKEFENLLAYSPLHNIEKGQCYPATLITTAERDDRVVPSHSFKFAAKLQEFQGCKKPILIRIEDRAGHGAGTPKDKQINQIAEIYGYALAVINE
jgi:prolyl oligopeptidase